MLGSEELADRNWFQKVMQKTRRAELGVPGANIPVLVFFFFFRWGKGLIWGF